MCDQRPVPRLGAQPQKGVAVSVAVFVSHAKANMQRGEQNDRRGQGREIE